MIEKIRGKFRNSQRKNLPEIHTHTRNFGRALLNKKKLKPVYAL